MLPSFQQLTALIRLRRSTFPDQYSAEDIPNDLLLSILDTARWAPNHKKTEPWRFIVFRGAAKKQLSNFLIEHYKSTTPSDLHDPLKIKKAGEKPLRASAVIAICVHHSPPTVLPAWEEIAAVSCAVQNLWLACACLGIGAYWSTPKAIEDFPKWQKLPENQECIGLFYMGWSQVVSQHATRQPLHDVVRFASAQPANGISKPSK